MRQALVPAVVLAAAIASPPAALAQAVTLPRAELPIREVDLADGTRRYVVTIQVAGHDVDAGLDTGSTGLRLLPRAAPVADVRAGEHVHYGYSSGIGLEGRVIVSPVAFGGVSGDAKLMRVDRVACDRPEAQCKSGKIDITSFGIMGDTVPGHGFAAILGIGLKPDPVPNPLEQLGIRRWIVELPRPGEAAGRLILNPRDNEDGDYTQLRFSDDGNHVAGCLVATDVKRKVCAQTVLDSGAPGIRLMGLQASPWPQGTAAAIVLGDGKAEAQMPIVIGKRELASGMFVQPGSQERRDPLISWGIAPYFHWSVLYDAGEHRIGLRERK